jgi:capsular exopolysaccharide synthesis family protein
MAKVYEALQKAEEERRRRQSGERTPVASLDWSPEDESSSRRKATPFWKRWLGLSRRGAAGEGIADLNKRRIAILQPDSYVAEQFRSLRGRIDSIAAQRPIKTLALTSANQDEGKSTAAINLAAVTAMSVGRQTLLVDCDLRQPQIHRSLGLEPKVGLAEVLLDQASLDDAILKVEGLNLHVLAVRAKPANPSELLASIQMRRLVEEMSRRYDRSILDTPATLGLPDAKTVSELCDGMVMVVRADVTPRQDLEAALDVLDRRRLLGLVLNGSDSARETYGYY